MSPVKCYYNECSNTSVTKSMFTFPIKDDRRLNLWIKHSGNTNLESLTVKELKHRYICEDHFKAGDVVKHDKRSRLAHTAVPLLYTPVIAQGNMSITHLSLEMLRLRYICIDHFEAKYISNMNGMRRRLSGSAVPIHYREPEILQESLLIATNEDNDLVLNKPDRVYKKPESATDRGTILVFDLGPCEDCGQPIKRFQWWCLQCGGARCLQCAQRMTHNAHLLLRAAAGGMDEKTRAIMENIREQLQIETVQVKEEIDYEGTENTQVENDGDTENGENTENSQSENDEDTKNGLVDYDEETDNDQAEDEDRLTQDMPEPEIEVEPHSSDFDPLAVKHEPDENRRRPRPARRGKRSPELDYRALNPNDRQLLDHNDHPFLGAELPLPSSKDIMDMNDFYGGYWPQDKRTRLRLHPSNNEENTDKEHNDHHNTTLSFSDTEHNDHYNTTLLTNSEHNTDTKQKSGNRIQKSKKSSEKSNLTIGIKRKNYRTQPNIKIFSISEIKRCTVTPKDNHTQESSIQELNNSEEGQNSTVNNNDNEPTSKFQIYSHSEKTVKQENSDHIQQTNIQVIDEKYVSKTNQIDEFRNIELPKVQVYSGHSEIESTDSQKNTRFNNK